MKNKILFATLFVLSYFLAPAQWANTNKPDADAVLCMTAIGGNIFVGTATGGLGGLFVSPDGGNTWSSDTNGIGHPPVGSITALGSKIFITTYTSVYVSVNNGVSWTPANNGLPNAQTGFIAVQGSIMYVGLGNNGVYRSNGSKWFKHFPR